MAESPRDRLIAALQELPRYMQVKLECLKEIGLILSTREDLVWYMLVQSMSGMGNNRGYKALMLNEKRFSAISWGTIKALPKSERRAHIQATLLEATVRMPSQKAAWLEDNFYRIEKMGGLSAALAKKRSLDGKSEKMKFFHQFSGIGEKYGRNIWMDLCDPDFENSIAIDERLEKIYKLLNISTRNYLQAEQKMLEIAHEAGFTGWEVDRLSFHFLDFFIQKIGGISATIKPSGNKSKRFLSVSKGVQFNNLSKKKRGRQSAVEKEPTSSRKQWETIYQRFLRRRNTSNLGKKAFYIKAIFKEFSNRVPLAVIVDKAYRENICLKIFNKKDDFNFIVYPIGMGIWTGALKIDDEYFIVNSHELLEN